MGRCAVCKGPGLRQAWKAKRGLDPNMRQMRCLNGHVWYETRRLPTPKRERPT